MKSKEGYLLNNPLPYIFFIFILASITYEMFSYNKLQAIIFACSFFVLLYFYKKIAVTIIMIIFFIIAIANNYFYYSYIPTINEIVRVEEVRSFSIKGKVNGRLVNLNIKQGDLKVGDRILIDGKCSLKKDISSGLIGVYEVNDYKVLKGDLISKLLNRREIIFSQIEKKLGTRKAGLITSIAFGYSDKLDGEDKVEMKNLGVTHAISVSGLHMVLVYGILKSIFGSAIALFLSFIYVLFTGAASSAIRSFIMIAIMSSAMLFKRNYNSIAALSLSGLILLIIKPYDIFSLGFILSFLATLGIVLFNKKLNKRLFKIPKYFRNTIAMSVATQILTLPIILLTFSEFSINFIFGNIIMLPILNVLVILGNTSLIFSKIRWIFNYILYLCHYCIKVIDIIIDYFWTVNMDILYFNYYVAYFYLALLITYYFYSRGIKRFIYFPLIMIVYISILIYSPIPNIRYFRDGALLFSYKGERILLQTKAIVDKKKLKNIAMVNKIYSDIKSIRINNIIISKAGKNFKVNIGDKEYLLLVNYDKFINDYDIIDFIDGDLQEVWVFNKRILEQK